MWEIFHHPFIRTGWYLLSKLFSTQQIKNVKSHSISISKKNLKNAKQFKLQTVKPFSNFTRDALQWRHQSIAKILKKMQTKLNSNILQMLMIFQYPEWNSNQSRFRFWVKCSKNSKCLNFSTSFSRHWWRRRFHYYPLFVTFSSAAQLKKLQVDTSGKSNIWYCQPWKGALAQFVHTLYGVQ